MQDDKEAFAAISGTKKFHNFNYCWAFEINSPDKLVLGRLNTHLYLLPPTFTCSHGVLCILVGKLEKLNFWCQLTMPKISVAGLWGPVSRWNKGIEMPSWLLLQAVQVMKMTVRDPISVHVLKAILKRWPAEKLLLEFKAFLIHKHELFAHKGPLLGKSYCYSWRRLLSHVNYVICSIGRSCVHENVSHAFWLVPWKLCQH